MSDLFNWFCSITREYAQGFAADGQTPVLSAGQVTIPSLGCRTQNTSGALEGIAANVSASIPSAPGAELDAGREGTVAASPAVPSFHWPVTFTYGPETLVERIENL